RALKHAQALGELFNTRRGIAVAGTHGKTTTTSMISFILERCGISPSFQIGGVSVDLGTSASWGQGEWMVIEADEFDRRFLEYRPEIAVVTNVEPDHFEYYGTYEQMRGAFADFLRQVQPQGTVVAYGDDLRLAGLLDEVLPPRVLRYGLTRGGAPAGLDICASDVELTGQGSRFTVTLASPSGSTQRTPVQLRVLGEHNVLNALAAIGASHLVGVPPAAAAEALSTFSGAERRFQLLADVEGIRLFEDYAHHPTEVRVNLEAAHRLVAPDGRLWAVFQPHLLTRTEMLFDEFTHAFDAADVVVIADVYSPAGREPAGNYRRSDALVSAIAARGHNGARHVPELADIRALLARELRAGDVVLVMGAGNVDELGRQAASDLKERAQTT
ncbi:MAG TPA: Mur ligase family protein, partial [Chloroflexota bacterium]|nr:Mur ligase family protein [Chloroflexota bacterium]